MLNPLETYLAALESRLQRLDPNRRVAELLEVRGHLESLAASHVEAGHNSDDAMRMALVQFGQAERIGGDLARVSLRPKRWEHARTLASRLLFYGFIVGGNFLFFWSINDKPTDFPHSLRSQFIMSALMALPSLFLGHLLEQGLKDWKARRKIA